MLNKLPKYNPSDAVHRYLNYLTISLLAGTGAGYFYGKSYVNEKKRLNNKAKQLLRLCHSDNKLVKENAIKQLVTLPLDSWQYIQLCQSCSPSVLCALHQSNEQFVQSSWASAIDSEATDILENRLERILNSLPSENVDSCVQHFTLVALHKPIKIHVNEENELLWSDEDQVADVKSFAYRPDAKRVLLYLEALSLQATIPEQCEIMASYGLERTLKTLCDNLPTANSTDKTEHSMLILALKIVTNLSLTSKASDMIKAGWLKTIDRLKRATSKLDVELLCTKVSYNLNSKQSDCRLLDGMYIVHKAPPTQEAAVDFVLVHGLRGGLFYSWRQKDMDSSLKRAKNNNHRTRCWPKDWLPEDLSIPFNIYGFDYVTLISDWGARFPRQTGSNIFKLRSEELKRQLDAMGLGSRPIVWITHSMGGLILKQLLSDIEESQVEEERKLLDQTKAVVFYSTPHFGSPVATYLLAANHRHLLLPSAEVAELVQTSPYLFELNRKFKTIVKSRKLPCLNIAEGKPIKVPKTPIDTLVVEPKSAYPGYGEFFKVDEIHLNTCKPEHRHSDNYRILLTFLKDLFV